MVSIDDITRDIDQALGDNGESPDIESAVGDMLNIPKASQSAERPPMRIFVACYTTSGMIVDPEDPTATPQRIEMFHHKAFQAPSLIAAASAIIGFELSEMREYRQGEPALDVNDAINDGRAKAEFKKCTNPDCNDPDCNNLIITIKRDAKGHDTRYIYVFDGIRNLNALMEGLSVMETMESQNREQSAEQEQCARTG